ncbi:hypothetical protein EVAR_41248_1 [Eumeta japonica]|uniref:Uncharacterized protein n=1 Tax=Eumeta variegata TaxID=151549 RepID=A0A4C1W356_EUMVA|nr:hypothetical protein EVAR_41248_1 [Eumeta japonica]
MKRLLILVVCLAVTSARPETYREKEDFQYSRSSTDEGSKSGFYGAQRGNTGGNYERAHNMDNLAQHQMSGVVRQVEGELGDAANSKRGNVFSSASTRGMYGQGNYDLSNLAGRNFQEGTSYADTLASSSSTASRNAGYTGHSSVYSGSGSRSSSLEAHDLQNANQYYSRQPQYGSSYQMLSQNNALGHRAYEHSASEHSASGHQSYEQSNYEANSRDSRYSSAMPTQRRPNSGITSAITAQAYDDSQRLQSANTDAEVLHNHDSVNTENRPRHYESSYSYRKEWERHNIVPAAIPSAITTQSPNFDMQNQNAHEQQEQQSQSNQQRYATNSRLTHNNDYGAESSGLQTQEGLSTSHVSGNSRSNYQSNYDADYNQRHQSSSSVLNSNMHGGGQRYSNLGASQSENQESIDTRPKAYQSSYSYHKSWERQGDPYTIQPVSGASANLQALNSDSSSANHNAYASHHYGSNHRRSHQSYSSSHNGNVDCDEDGHVRVARSYRTDFQNEQEQMQNIENQQRLSHAGRLESFDQQSLNNDFQDMGQQIQTNFANSGYFGQQEQDLANLEDLGQQSLINFGQLEDFGQQKQESFGNLEDLGQHIQGGSASLENLGKEEQSKFENFGQHIQDETTNLTDLGQQAQTGFESLQNFGQHIQGGSANLEDLGQQTQASFGNLEDFGQHTQGSSTNLSDLGQQMQTNFGNLEEFGQQSQNDLENLENFEQKTQTDLQNFDQQSEDNNLGQQIQGGFPDLDNSKTEKGILQNFDQETQSKEDITQNNQYDFSKLETMNQQVQKELPNLNNFDQQVQAENTNEKEVQREIQTNGSNLVNLEHQFQLNLNNTNLDEDRKEGLQFNVFNQNSDNTLGQEHSTFDHIHPVDNISPTENSKNTSQSSFDNNQKWNENSHYSDNDNTYEQSYYHTSSSNFNSSRQLSHSQVSQNDRQDIHSNQQTNDAHNTSDLDSLWNEIFDLMDNIQADRKDNETKESKKTQNALNSTQESLITNVNNANEKTSQNDHSYTNTDNENKPIVVEPVLSPNYGRGDIESDDFSSVTELSTKHSLVPIMFANEDPKKPYKTPKEIETLSLITETATIKENNNENQHNINNQIHKLDTNSYNKDEIIKIDNYTTKLQEQGPEEVSGNDEKYESYRAPNQHFEELEHQSSINQNDFDNNEKLNQFHQIQSLGNEDFGQEIQTNWNTNEDLVQQIQTAWNPIEQEQPFVPERDFDQVNLNILPQDRYTQSTNLNYDSEQYINREEISNLHNELITHQNSNNPNDKTDSTTDLISTIESATEKAGFWHSVGDKFSNAKNKIVSWFHRS